MKRCAIYCRKSVADAGEFTSIDAQRASVLAYIESQKSLGWRAIDERFEDNGFTGADLNRPGYKRLAAEIAAGHVDVVACYRADRLSRRYLDFANLLHDWEQAGVMFCSVTEQFSTTTASGRLFLGMILNFSSFERELVGERTRDKIAASRRAGRHSAGRSTLGFDVRDGQLIVNEGEAPHVRQIFAWYRESKSLLAVAERANAAGFKTKSFVRRDGSTEGGQAFTSGAVHRLLTNVTITGHVKCGDEIIKGIHPAIVPEAEWREVQSILRSNNRAGWKHERRPARTLLTGLLYCGTCGGRYLTAFSGGPRKYGSYQCSKMRQRGADACKQSRVPVSELDNAVLREIRMIGRDPAIFEATLRAAREAVITRKPELESERDRLDGELRKLAQKRSALVDAIANGNAAGRDAILKKLGEIDVENDRLSRELERVRGELRSLECATIDEVELKRVLEQFDDAWDALVLEERRRLLALVVERIEFDGQARSLRVRFRANALSALSKKGSDAHE
ncbi:MAG: recombinase family protein [Planctomycetes bacterium]|nr:recombinase family protein [Planctomycetota bacterium]